MSSCSDARSNFPAGLIQPKGSFRFSADALCLADFALSALKGPEAVADLGAGCGVVGLKMLMARPELRLVAVEREKVLAEAVVTNSRHLGLSCRVLCADVRERQALTEARRCLEEAPSDLPSGPPLFDAVVCNPPWRTAGAGRSSPSELRRRALEMDSDGFTPFVLAADSLLKVGAPAFFVAGADKTAELLASLPERLHVVRLRFVYGSSSSSASFVLLEARKKSRAALTVEAPLFL